VADCEIRWNRSAEWWSPDAGAIAAAEAAAVAAANFRCYMTVVHESRQGVGTKRHKLGGRGATTDRGRTRPHRANVTSEEVVVPRSGVWCGSGKLLLLPLMADGVLVEGSEGRIQRESCGIYLVILQVRKLQLRHGIRSGKVLEGIGIVLHGGFSRIRIVLRGGDTGREI